MTFSDMDGGGFSPPWIFGDTFILTCCNIYDIANKQIGFAKAIHNGLYTSYNTHNTSTSSHTVIYIQGAPIEVLNT